MVTNGAQGVLLRVAIKNVILPPGAKDTMAHPNAVAVLSARAAKIGPGAVFTFSPDLSHEQISAILANPVLTVRSIEIAGNTIKITTPKEIEQYKIELRQAFDASHGEGMDKLIELSDVLVPEEYEPIFREFALDGAKGFTVQDFEDDPDKIKKKTAFSQFEFHFSQLIRLHDHAINKSIIDELSNAKKHDLFWACWMLEIFMERYKDRIEYFIAYGDMNMQAECYSIALEAYDRALKLAPAEEPAQNPIQPQQKKHFKGNKNAPAHKAKKTMCEHDVVARKLESAKAKASAQRYEYFKKNCERADELFKKVLNGISEEETLDILYLIFSAIKYEEYFSESRIERNVPEGKYYLLKLKHLEEFCRKKAAGVKDEKNKDFWVNRMECLSNLQDEFMANVITDVLRERSSLFFQQDMRTGNYSLKTGFIDLLNYMFQVFSTEEFECFDSKLLKRLTDAAVNHTGMKYAKPKFGVSEILAQGIKTHADTKAKAIEVIKQQFCFDILYAQAYLHKANADGHFKAGDIDSAINEVKNALLYFNDKVFMEALAVLLFAKADERRLADDMKTYYELCDEIFKIDPKNIRILAIMTQKALTEGRHEDAIKLTQMIIDQKDGCVMTEQNRAFFAAAHEMLGREALKLAQQTESPEHLAIAGKNLKIAEEMTKNNPLLLISLSEIQLMRGNYEGAEKILNKAVLLNEDVWGEDMREQIINSLSILFVSVEFAKKQDKGMKAFIGTYVESLVAIVGIGNLDFESEVKILNIASSFYEQGMDNEGDRITEYFLTEENEVRSQSYYYARYVKAIKAYSEKNYWEVYRLLNYDFVEAKIHAETFSPHSLKNEPLNAVVFNLLSGTYQAMMDVHKDDKSEKGRGDYKLALNGLIYITEIAEKTLGRTVFALNSLAVTYQKVGFYKKAEKAYKEAIAANPDFLFSYVNLIDLYYIMKRQKEAVDVLAQLKGAIEQSFAKKEEDISCLVRLASGEFYENLIHVYISSKSNDILDLIKYILKEGEAFELIRYFAAGMKYVVDKEGEDVIPPEILDLFPIIPENEAPAQV